MCNCVIYDFPILIPALVRTCIQSTYFLRGAMLQKTFLAILLILKAGIGLAVIGDDTIGHYVETITNSAVKAKASCVEKDLSKKVLS